jgi:hypothetical protein
VNFKDLLATIPTDDANDDDARFPLMDEPVVAPRLPAPRDERLPLLPLRRFDPAPIRNHLDRSTAKHRLS